MFDDSRFSSHLAGETNPAWEKDVWGDDPVPSGARREDSAAEGEASQGSRKLRRRVSQDGIQVRIIENMHSFYSPQRTSLVVALWVEILKKNQASKINLCDSFQCHVHRREFQWAWVRGGRGRERLQFNFGWGVINWGDPGRRRTIHTQSQLILCRRRQPPQS